MPADPAAGNEALVRRYFEAVNHAFRTGEVAALDELFAPEYAERLRVGGPPPTLEGLKQFIQLIRAAIPDARVMVEDVVAGGDRVAVRHRHLGTLTGPFLGLPPTGKPLDFQGVEIARIAGGKIAESWHIDDNLALMQQAGALPPSGQAPGEPAPGAAARG